MKNKKILMSEEERRRIVNAALPKEPKATAGEKLLQDIERVQLAVLGGLKDIVDAQGFVGDHRPLKEMAIKLYIQHLQTLDKDHLVAMTAIVMAPGAVDKIHNTFEGS